MSPLFNLQFSINKSALFDSDTYLFWPLTWRINSLDKNQ